VATTTYKINNNENRKSYTLMVCFNQSLKINTLIGIEKFIF
jgi:hypothetical protein